MSIIVALIWTCLTAPNTDKRHSIAATLALFSLRDGHVIAPKAKGNTAAEAGGSQEEGRVLGCDHDILNREGEIQKPSRCRAHLDGPKDHGAVDEGGEGGQWAVALFPGHFHLEVGALLEKGRNSEPQPCGEANHIGRLNKLSHSPNLVLVRITWGSGFKFRFLGPPVEVCLPYGQSGPKVLEFQWVGGSWILPLDLFTHPGQWHRAHAEPRAPVRHMSQGLLGL